MENEVTTGLEKEDLLVGEEEHAVDSKALHFDLDKFWYNFHTALVVEIE